MKFKQRLINTWKKINTVKSPLATGKKLPKAQLVWRAPEFFMVKKSYVWGAVIIVIFLALAAIMVALGQLLTAVVAVLFIIVILKLAYAKPEIIEYRIEQEGVRIAGWLHPFADDIVAFWTGHVGNRPQLYLQTRNIVTDHMAIPLGNIPLKKAVRVLEKHIPERLPPSTPRVAHVKRT